MNHQIERHKEIINSLFKFIPGGIFGILSVSLMFIFVYLSYINFPGYTIAENDVSVLGIGPGLSSIFFNTGLKIAGIMAIPFFFYLAKLLIQNTDDLKDIRFLKVAIKLSILGCVALTLLGFFPVINFEIGIIHAFLALIFFTCSFTNLIIFSNTMLKDGRFSSFHSYIGFIIAGLIGFYIATRWSLVEWLVFFCLGFYLLDISIYTIIKRLK